MRLADLSFIDRETLYLRGASGEFKPENDSEAALVRGALSAGASMVLDPFAIEDFTPGVSTQTAAAAGR